MDREELEKNFTEINSPEIIFQRNSTSLDGLNPEIDPKAERRLVMKLDLILLPLFTLICECEYYSDADEYTYSYKTVATSLTGTCDHLPSRDQYSSSLFVNVPGQP